MPDINILYIEDEPGQRSALGKSLRERGFGVVEAASGSEGLELLSDQIEVVLCDLNMPGMSGLEVLHQVQRRHPDMPFISMPTSAFPTSSVSPRRRSSSGARSTSTTTRGGGRRCWSA
jgi:CheY-like chemotaxis protein